MIDLGEVSLPPRVCCELTRIFQEGLVNVPAQLGAQYGGPFRPRGQQMETGDDDDSYGFDLSGRLSDVIWMLLAKARW